MSVYNYVYWLTRYGWSNIEDDWENVFLELREHITRSCFTDSQQISELVTICAAVRHCVLLDTYTEWPSQKDAEKSLELMLQGEDGPGTIEKYILSVGADRSNVFMKMIGALYSNMCKEEIVTLPVSHLEPINNRDVIQRFRMIIANYAEKCTYERSGDIYIHLLLRSKLSSFKNAVTITTPYDSISDEYGDAANELVRPFIETSPGVKEKAIKWNGKTDIEDFHFVVSLIREMCDGNEVNICINSFLTQVLDNEVPHLFTFTSDYECIMGKVYGFYHNLRLYIPKKGSESPLTDCLIHFILKASEYSEAISQLKTALFDPNQLPATSPYSSLLNVSQQ